MHAPPPEWVAQVTTYLHDHPGATVAELGAAIAPALPLILRAESVRRAEHHGLITLVTGDPPAGRAREIRAAGPGAALTAWASGVRCYLAGRAPSSRGSDDDTGPPAPALPAGGHGPYWRPAGPDGPKPNFTRATFAVLERIAVTSGLSMRAAVQGDKARWPDSRKYAGVKRLIAMGLVRNDSGGRYARLEITAAGVRELARINAHPEWVLGPECGLVGPEARTVLLARRRAERGQQEAGYAAVITAYFGAHPAATAYQGAMVLERNDGRLTRNMWRSRIDKLAITGTITPAVRRGPQGGPAPSDKVLREVAGWVDARAWIPEDQVARMILDADLLGPSPAMRAAPTYDEYRAASMRAARLPYVYELLARGAELGLWVRRAGTWRVKYRLVEQVRLYPVKRAPDAAARGGG